MRGLRDRERKGLEFLWAGGLARMGACGQKIELQRAMVDASEERFG